MSKTDEEFECVSNGSFNVNEISYDNISDDELTDPISNFNIGSALKPDQHSSNNNEFKLETIKRDDWLYAISSYQYDEKMSLREKGDFFLNF